MTNAFPVMTIFIHVIVYFFFKKIWKQTKLKHDLVENDPQATSYDLQILQAGIYSQYTKTISHKSIPNQKNK